MTDMSERVAALEVKVDQLTGKVDGLADDVRRMVELLPKTHGGLTLAKWLLYLGGPLGAWWALAHGWFSELFRK